MANPYVAAAGLILDVGSKLIEGRTEEAFDGLNPTATAGGLLEVTFETNGQQQIPHKLGKKPEQGWQRMYQSQRAIFWDYQEPDDRFLYIEMSDATVATTIKILVS